MRRARPSLRGRAPAPGLGEPQLRQQARRDGRLGGGENDVLDRVMFDAMAISVRAVGRGIAVGRRRRGGVGRGRLPTRRRVWRIGFFRRAHRRRHGRARDQNQPTGDGGVHGADLIALRQRRSRPGRVCRQKHGADRGDPQRLAGGAQPAQNLLADANMRQPPPGGGNLGRRERRPGGPDNPGRGQVDVKGEPVAQRRRRLLVELDALVERNHPDDRRLTLLDAVD